MTVDDVQKIVDMTMELCDCDSQAKLAEEMGMISQNFNQKKKRKTIVKQIEKFLKKKGVDTTFISIIRGDKKPEEEQTKGGDYTKYLQMLIDHLQEENERLKGELLRLRTREFDRRKSVKA